MSALPLPPTLARRLVRYAELQPCTTAFIDARTPGSERKENFTIIGPGVAENPDQHVHIDIPHGFNIGGARQPPGCVNSQHSHETAEVFVVLNGQWRFMSGERGSDGFVELGPGDTISIPTQAFRGFENVGKGLGFMFAVLGGDDPGRVLWAPYVFEAAREHGLVLLESGRLIDTARQPLPADAKPMPATTAADIARLRRLDSKTLESCVQRLQSLLAAADSAANEHEIIGPRAALAPLRVPHGFTLHVLRLHSGDVIARQNQDTAEVVMMFSGNLTAECSDGTAQLFSGDTFSIPQGSLQRYTNRGAQTAVAFLVRPSPAVSSR